MNPIRSFQNLTKTEKSIWGVSVAVITLSFIFGGSGEVLTLLSSLIGASALIFVSKGDALGQALTVLFALFYAAVSWQCRYYGEMITYLGMTLPSALAALITWIRNPYKDMEVKVKHLTAKHWVFLSISAVFVTVAFYYILRFFGNASLFFSTISITTSYFASMLTVFRSPYYAIAYALNDVVLIILWGLASLSDISYLPMILCFIIFLVNDIYGFINWRAIRRRQENHL